MLSVILKSAMDINIHFSENVDTSRWLLSTKINNDIQMTMGDPKFVNVRL